jgi:dUTP pyrophosphatase
MELKYTKTNSRAMEPVRGTDHSAGIDLIAISKAKSREFIDYGTGLAFEIPINHVGLLFPRSSVSKTGLMLANSVGVIDSDYRGEIRFRFKKVDIKGSEYNIGDRVGQLVVVPIPSIDLHLVSELSDTDRGEGGFGSTGN